jgi:uncharacterized paraquat-inducible protein A
MTARPHPALSHRALYRALVDDRHLHIDISMESLLGALVAFGSVITIEPGAGALAFCAVAVLTMFAAETF